MDLKIEEQTVNTIMNQQQIKIDDLITWRQ